MIGYVLWPGARRLPRRAHLDDGVAAAGPICASRDAAGVAYRVRGGGDDAYRLAHDARSACLAAFAEPPPVPAKARAMLPYAEELEEIVDGITDIAAVPARPRSASAGRPDQRRLDDLRVAVSRSPNWFAHRRSGQQRASGSSGEGEPTVDNDGLPGDPRGAVMPGMRRGDRCRRLAKPSQWVDAGDVGFAALVERGGELGLHHRGATALTRIVGASSTASC